MCRTRFAVVAIVVLIALGIWVSRRTEQPPPIKTQSPGAISPRPNESRNEDVPLVPGRAEASPPQLVRASTGPTRSPVSAAATASPIPPDAEAMMEIDQVNLMIRDYRTIAGENPVGTN